MMVFERRIGYVWSRVHCAGAELCSRMKRKTMRKRVFHHEVYKNGVLCDSFHFEIDIDCFRRSSESSPHSKRSVGEFTI